MIQIELIDEGFFFLELNKPPGFINAEFVETLALSETKDTSIETHRYWFSMPHHAWYLEGTMPYSEIGNIKEGQFLGDWKDDDTQ